MKQTLLSAFILMSAHHSFSQNYVMDTSFGSNGVRWHDSSSVNSTARDVAGNFYLAGEKRTLAQFAFAFCVLKLHPDGTRDGSFGNNGLATFDLGYSGQDLLGVAVQPDGKVVFVGSLYIAPSRDAIIGRFTATGELDTTFNGTGYRIFDGNNQYDAFYRVKVQPDGKLIAAGYSCFGGQYDYKLAACRFNSNGTPDVGFANNGFYRHSTDGWVNKLILDGSSIVMAGGMGNNSSDYCVVRLDSIGTPDPTFGSNGTFIYQESGENFIADMVPDGNGYIGICYSVDGNPNWNDAKAKFLRVTHAGELDTTVLGGGIFTLPADSGFSHNPTCCLKSGTTIIGAGGYFPTGNTNGNLDAVLYQVNIASGSVVTSNGANGLVTYSIPAHNELFYFMHEETNGDLILGGDDYDSPMRQSFITRFINQPVSVNELQISNSSLTIYPNPFAGELHLSIPQKNIGAQLTIHDTTGRLLLQTRTDENTVLNTENFSKGIYLLRFITDQGEVSAYKVIKQ